MIIDNCDALIFDLDGTLYDKKNILFNTMASHWMDIATLHAANKLRKALKGVDLGGQDEFYRTFYGGIGEAAGRKPQWVESWYMDKFYPRFIRTLEKKYRARSGLADLLDKLKGKIPMAVFSDYSHVHQRLEALGIDPGLFDCLAGSEEYGVLKPSARPLLDIAGKMGTDPSRVFVVGDRTDTDGEAASLAGMKFFHIQGSDSWEKFLEEMKYYMKKRG